MLDDFNDDSGANAQNMDRTQLVRNDSESLRGDPITSTLDPRAKESDGSECLSMRPLFRSQELIGKICNQRVS